MVENDFSSLETPVLLGAYSSKEKAIEVILSRYEYFRGVEDAEILIDELNKWGEYSAEEQEIMWILDKTKVK